MREDFRLEWVNELSSDAHIVGEGLGSLSHEHNRSCVRNCARQTAVAAPRLKKVDVPISVVL
jgi:hypothetical protein